MDVASVVLGLILAILWAEGAAWLPALTRRLVRASARRLEADLRERMEEEWLRYVQDMPGTLGPFLAGCQCMWASVKICPIRIQTRFPRLQHAVKPLSLSLFRERDLFVHDGQRLRRFRIPARLQAAMFIVLLLMVAWAGYATAKLVSA